MGLYEMFKEWVLTNPNAQVMSFLLGVVGIIVAVVMANIQRTRRLLEYQYYTVEIVNPLYVNASDLEVLYKKKKITQLSVTRCIIVNTGNTYIDYSHDVYEGHPICIEVSNSAEILSAELLYVSDDVICQDHASIEVKDNKAILLFNTIERKKYMSVNIYHTGTVESKINVIGRLKAGDIRPHKSSMLTKAGLTIAFILGEYAFVEEMIETGSYWFFGGIMLVWIYIYYLGMNGRIQLKDELREELLSRKMKPDK